jgi:hypothetical protein
MIQAAAADFNFKKQGFITSAWFVHCRDSRRVCPIMALASCNATVTPEKQKTPVIQVVWSELQSERLYVRCISWESMP